MWRSECVGLVVLDLPGDAIVAGISQKDLRDEILTPSQAISSRFDDGQLAPWARVLYKGELLVSNKLDAFQKDVINADFGIAKKLVGKRLKEMGLETDAIRDVTQLPRSTKAWETQSSVRILVDLGEHLLFTRISEPGRGAAAIEEARTLAKNITYRAVFDVPGSRGICLPNAYVKDGNAAMRNVAVMYRLIDHPDVSVYLRDANSARYDEPVRERNAAPKRLNENFWAQYESKKSVARILSISRTSARFPLLKGWRSGFASVAAIERKNGLVDSGYFAALRGDPEVPGTRELELAVIQDSENAKARGAVPLTREQFTAMISRLPETVRDRGE